MSYGRAKGYALDVFIASFILFILLVVSEILMCALPIRSCPVNLDPPFLKWLVPASIIFFVCFFFGCFYFYAYVKTVLLLKSISPFYISFLYSISFVVLLSLLASSDVSWWAFGYELLRVFIVSSVPHWQAYIKMHAKWEEKKQGTRTSSASTKRCVSLLYLLFTSLYLIRRLARLKCKHALLKLQKWYRVTEDLLHQRFILIGRLYILTKN